MSYVCAIYIQKDPVTDMQKTLEWDTLEIRLCKSVATMGYKIVHSLVAIPATQLTLAKDSTGGNGMAFIQISTSTNYNKYSFFPALVKIWNSLPADLVSVIPLSHYSRNAPPIHNVGHFFQIAKVPSGVCKFRHAFVLDSAMFVAIAKCSQMHLRVGNLFHFSQNSWAHWEPNTTNIRVYEYDTMKQERKTTLVQTFVQIHCDMVENERNARRLYYESHDPYTNILRYWRIRELGNNVVRFT